ncbi:MAG TPA: helix-turn-helix domain-containing protein [Pyrinomonadaceae bacterium]|jgi:excisionase family DNA binding protein|nr:helix-turn-helix domain-containing protein [Pyrinomonadaceae bacterium]
MSEIDAYKRGLLSEKEAAAFLGVSRITLLRMRQAARIGFYRVGTRVLYSQETHLQPFLDKCERKPKEAA